MKDLFIPDFKSFLIFLLFVGGCAGHKNSASEVAQRNSNDLPPHPMIEKGIWTGEGKLVTLYEHNGKPVSALCLIIGPGQVKKETIGGKPVLIDKHLKLINPEAYLGKMLKVKGMIYPEWPLNPADGASLRSVDLRNTYTNDEFEFTAVEVIKINQKNIVILGSSDSKSGR
jgi:hypothetical protein